MLALRQFSVAGSGGFLPSPPQWRTSLADVGDVPARRSPLKTSRINNTRENVVRKKVKVTDLRS